MRRFIPRIPMRQFIQNMLMVEIKIRNVAKLCIEIVLQYIILQKCDIFPWYKYQITAFHSGDYFLMCFLICDSSLFFFFDRPARGRTIQEC